MYPQNRRELRSCYSRAAWALMAYLVLMELFIYLSYIPYFLGAYDLYYSVGYDEAVNAVIVFFPGIIAFGLVLRPLPKPRIYGKPPKAKDVIVCLIVAMGFLYIASTVTDFLLAGTETVDYANESVAEIINADGIDELAPVITSMKSYVAPFVNAEETEYLVIEDDFPNGRPALEKGGIMFTDRETVDKVEKMKVCTCLNPLHTALAVYGCLLGYDLISKEMEDEDLVSLVRTMGYKEGLPVVINPGILDPKEFIDTVLKVRIPNPFMPDTPQRIATDTSQKLAIRFGETIKAYHKAKDLDVADLKLIPLVQAGWLRYMMGVDDNGEAFELSPDPLAHTVCPVMEQVKLGETKDAEEIIAPLLHNDAIFGVDLYEVGMAPMVVKYFNELIAGPGAVRATLVKYVH